MLARNSQGLLVSLLSPNPRSSELEDRSQSWDAGEGAHKYDINQGAHLKDKVCSEKEEGIKEEGSIEDEEGFLKPRDRRSEKEEGIKKEGSTEDEKGLLKLSDIACKSAEYDEVWILLIRTRLFMLTAGEEDASSRVYRPPLLLQHGPRSQLLEYWSKHQQHRAWSHWSSHK